MTLSTSEKSILSRYLSKVTDYSRQPLTRLIKQCKNVGNIHWHPSRSNGFSTTYDTKGIKFLVGMDTRPKGNVWALHFFVVPIQKVADIQSLTRLELKHPSRSETRTLRWYGYIS